MKKLFTLFALMCLTVMGVWAQNLWTLSPTDGSSNLRADDLGNITITFSEDLFVTASGYDWENDEINMDTYRPTLTNADKSVVENATLFRVASENGLKFHVSFPTSQIVDGLWTLNFPEGTFTGSSISTGDDVSIPAITASYTVGTTPAPAKDPYILSPANNANVTSLNTITVTFNDDLAQSVSVNQEAPLGTLSCSGKDDIYGYIEARQGSTGVFDITFADVTDGNWSLNIPEGTFLVGSEDYPEITAAYNVYTPAPVDAEYTFTPNPATTISNTNTLSAITISFEDVVTPVEYNYEGGGADIPLVNGHIPTLSNGSIEVQANGFQIGNNGSYVMTFPTNQIANGNWTLTIPQGTFAMEEWNTEYEVMDIAPINKITVSYTVDLPTTYTYDVTVVDNGAGVNTLKIGTTDYTSGTATEAFLNEVNASRVTATEVTGYAHSLEITQPTTTQHGTIVLTYHKLQAGEMPVAGKVYTVYNDHLGVPYYVTNTLKDGCQALTTNQASDDSQKWIVWGNQTTGYTLYNLANKSIVMKAYSGSTFDFKNYHKLTGISIFKHNSNEEQAGSSTTLTLQNGMFTTTDPSKVYNDEGYEWSTDFVFLPTGQLAYHVEGGKGGQVQINGQTYTAGMFCVSETALTDGNISTNAGYTATVTGNVVYVKKDGSVADESIAMLNSPGTYYVYIKDNTSGKYLYNDRSEGTDVTLEGMTTSPGLDNAYIWRITSDGTDFDIINGQGFGYKADENAIEKTHGAIANIPTPWAIESVYMTDKKVWDVEVWYNENGYITGDEHYSSKRAYNGGFFVTASSVGSILGPINDSQEGVLEENYKLGRADLSASGWNYGRIEQDPGTNAKGHLILRYFSDEQEADYYYLAEQWADAFDKMTYYDEEGNPCSEVGYPAQPDLMALFEDDETKDLYLLFSADRPEYYQEIVAAYNYFVEHNTDVVMPQPGEAFKLSVRSNDGHKRWYLKSDGTLTDPIDLVETTEEAKAAIEADAEIFVMGSTGVEGFTSLFASNNNSDNSYLRSNGPTENYEAGVSDFNLKLMVTENDLSRVQADSYCRFGTFGFQAKGTSEGSTATITLNEINKTWKVTDTQEPLMKGYYTSAIEMTKVAYPYNLPKLAVGTPDDHEGGYASIWLPYPMVFPDGVEVYRATEVENDGILRLTLVNTEKENAVAAGGYIIRDPKQTAATAVWTVLPAPANPEQVVPCEDNLFCGSTENPTVVKEEGSWSTFKAKHEGTAYVLAKKSNGIGYYKYTDTEYLPKGKAIWFSSYSSEKAANCLQFSFGDIVSAIEALHGNTTAGTDIYDLQGRRLDKVQKGQINVINGKKVMFN